MTVLGLVILLVLLAVMFKYIEPYANADMLRLAIFVIVVVVFILLLQMLGVLHLGNLRIS